MLEIKEYAKRNESDVKDLLVELQRHLMGLDKRGVLTLKESFRDGYFDYVQKEVLIHDGIIFVAEKDEKAIGCIICKIFCGGGESEFTTVCPKVGFISDLVVKSEERGNGIGKLFIRSAEEYFKDNNCEYVQLEVFKPNANAKELYEKLGFEDICIYMSKSL